MVRPRTGVPQDARKTVSAAGWIFVYTEWQIRTQNTTQKTSALIIFMVKTGGSTRINAMSKPFKAAV